MDAVATFIIKTDTNNTFLTAFLKYGKWNNMNH